MSKAKSSSPRRSKSPRKKAPSADLKNNAGVVNVDWNRDVKGNIPQQAKDQLSALSMLHSDTRKQLAALRATRGQRDVGTLKIPAHLQAPIPMNDSGVHRTAGPSEE